MFKRIIMIIAILAIVTGCRAETETEKESATEVSSIAFEVSDNVPVQIGVMSDVGAVPFIVAEELGYFDDFDIDVDIVVFKSAVDRDSALQTGNLNAAMADMLSIVFYTDAELPIKMVAKTAGDYVMLTSPTVSLADFNLLDEALVGISSNTVIDFTTDYIAQQKGITQKIKGMAIPQMPVRLEMLKSGELQAATLPDPLASAAQAEGSEIVGRTGDYGLTPGILVMDEQLIASEATTTALIGAYNKAAEWLNTHGDGEIYDVLVSQLGFSESLRGTSVLPTYEPLSLPDRATFEIVSKWMYDRGLTQQKYDFDALCADLNLNE